MQNLYHYFFYYYLHRIPSDFFRLLFFLTNLTSALNISKFYKFQNLDLTIIISSKQLHDVSLHLTNKRFIPRKRIHRFIQKDNVKLLF